MNDLLLSTSKMFSYIKRDNVNILLALIPIFIGIVIYFLLGQFIFTTLYGLGSSLITSWISSGTFGTALSYVVGMLFSVLFYFIISFTFVLVITLLASPFNDLLSSRIEKLYLGQEVQNLDEAFKGLMAKVFFTLFNEAKKIAFIIILVIASFILGYIPILTPLSVAISGLLLAIEFLDYSWSRRDMKFSDCIKNVKSNLLVYTIAGLGFFVLVSIPIINLLVPALATSYFTILFLKRNSTLQESV